MKKLLVVCLLAFSGAALAQVVPVPIVGQTQASTVASTSGADNHNNGSQVLNSYASEIPTSTSIKTTGTAIAPTITNSSGTYTCFGGASVAAGFLGGAISAGTTVKQDECYRLYLMDKAASRVNTAPVYAVVWDALYCQFPDGQAAYEAAGLKCPSPTATKTAPVAAIPPSTIDTDKFAANVYQPLSPDPFIRQRQLNELHKLAVN